MLCDYCGEPILTDERLQLSLQVANNPKGVTVYFHNRHLLDILQLLAVHSDIVTVDKFQKAIAEDAR